MKFIIVTHIPARQGLLGPIKEQNTIDVAEAESVEEIKDGLHVPLGGFCYVVEKEHVKKFASRNITEEVND